MAHTKGWGASAAIKRDVSGAQVLNVRRVCSLAETRSLCCLYTYAIYNHHGKDQHPVAGHDPARELQFHENDFLSQHYITDSFSKGYAYYDICIINIFHFFNETSAGALYARQQGALEFSDRKNKI